MEGRGLGELGTIWEVGSAETKILTLRAPAEAISVLGGPMAKYFGCQKDMVFRVDCYQGCYVINPSGGKAFHTK